MTKRVGRPPLPEHWTLHVRVPRWLRGKSVRRWLRLRGSGNASRGLRRIIDEDIERNQEVERGTD